MITYKKIIPSLFLFVGLFLLMQIIMPIVSFKIWEWGKNFEDSSLTTPQVASGSQILGVSIQNDENFPIFISSRVRQIKPDYSQFNLTISKLNLDEVSVFLDTNDLAKGLIHLPGSALPGEKGNVFISGHSAGSIFFSPRKVYFSKLQDLKKGDEIVVNAGGSKFVYKVVGMRAVDPKNLSVVNAPDEQGRYISLMTCVPPGLNFKRLVVLGKMI